MKIPEFKELCTSQTNFVEPVVKDHSQETLLVRVASYLAQVDVGSCEKKKEVNNTSDITLGPSAIAFGVSAVEGELCGGIGRIEEIRARFLGEERGLHDSQPAEVVVPTPACGCTRESLGGETITELFRHESLLPLEEITSRVLEGSKGASPAADTSHSLSFQIGSFEPLADVRTSAVLPDTLDNPFNRCDPASPGSCSGAGICDPVSLGGDGGVDNIQRNTSAQKEQHLFEEIAGMQRAPTREPAENLSFLHSELEGGNSAADESCGETTGSGVLISREDFQKMVSSGCKFIRRPLDKCPCPGCTEERSTTEKPEKQICMTACGEVLLPEIPELGSVDSGAKHVVPGEGAGLWHDALSEAPDLGDRDVTRRSETLTRAVLDLNLELGTVGDDATVIRDPLSQVPELVVTPEKVLAECLRWGGLATEKTITANGPSWEEYDKEWQQVMREVATLTERPIRVSGPFADTKRGLLEIAVPSNAIPVRSARLLFDFNLTTGAFDSETPSCDLRTEGDRKTALFETGSNVDNPSTEAEFVPRDVALSRAQDALSDIAVGPEWVRELLVGNGMENSCGSNEDGSPRGAAGKVVRSVLDSAGRSYTLVVGPPATGKSRLIYDLVREFLRRNPKEKVLVCGQQNAAVEAIASRFCRCPGLRIVQRVSTMKKVTSPAVAWERDRVMWEIGMQAPESLFGAIIDVREKLSAGAAGKKTKSMRHLLSSLQEKAERIVGNQTQVLLSTTAMLSESDGTFGLVVLDEAAQASEMDSLCALARCSSHFVLVGDHHQHEPHSFLGQIPKLSTSLMERLMGRASSSPFHLCVQYRCPEVIAKFVSHCFYGGRVSSAGKFGSEAQYEVEQPLTWHPLKQVGSWTQSDEATETVLREVLQLLSTGVRGDQVLVISPWRAQVDALQAALPEKVAVKTAIQVQGEEHDFVLLVIPLGHSLQDVHHNEWIANPRQLNVSLTRTKSACRVYCNPAVVQRESCGLLKLLYDYVDSLGGVTENLPRVTQRHATLTCGREGLPEQAEIVHHVTSVCGRFIANNPEKRKQLEKLVQDVCSGKRSFTGSFEAGPKGVGKKGGAVSSAATLDSLWAENDEFEEDEPTRVGVTLVPAERFAADKALRLLREEGVPHDGTPDFDYKVTRHPEPEEVVAAMFKDLPDLEAGLKAATEASPDAHVNALLSKPWALAKYSVPKSALTRGSKRQAAADTTNCGPLSVRQMTIYNSDSLRACITKRRDHFRALVTTLPLALMETKVPKAEVQAVEAEIFALIPDELKSTVEVLWDFAEGPEDWKEGIAFIHTGGWSAVELEKPALLCGRALLVRNDELLIIFVYCKYRGFRSVDTGETLRQKEDDLTLFETEFLEFVAACRDYADSNRLLMGIAGDFNVSAAGDHHLEVKSTTDGVYEAGTLPQDRAWLDAVRAAGGPGDEWLQDPFKTLYPDARGHFTAFPMVGKCLERNVGERIDFFPSRERAAATSA